MLNSFLPILYGIAVLILFWKAFRVMGRGFNFNEDLERKKINFDNSTGDRTGRLTIHPDLLDQDGRITDEELLTVRFSGDNDSLPPNEAKAE